MDSPLPEGLNNIHLSSLAARTALTLLFPGSTGLHRPLRPTTAGATVVGAPSRRRCSKSSARGGGGGGGGGSAGVTMDGGSGGHRIETEDGGVSTLTVTVGGREVCNKPSRGVEPVRYI